MNGSGDPLDMVGIGHGWYGYNLQPLAGTGQDDAIKRHTSSESGNADPSHTARFEPGSLMADQLFGGVDYQHGTPAAAAATAAQNNQTLTAQGGQPSFVTNLAGSHTNLPGNYINLPGNFTITSDTLLSPNPNFRNPRNRQQQSQHMQHLLQNQPPHLSASSSSPFCIAGFDNSNHGHISNDNANNASLIASWATIPINQPQGWLYPGFPMTNTIAQPTTTLLAPSMGSAMPGLNRSADTILNSPLNFGMMNQLGGMGLGLGMSVGEMQTAQQQQQHLLQQQQHQRFLEQNLQATTAAATGRGGGVPSGGCSSGNGARGGAGLAGGGAVPGQQDFGAQGASTGGSRRRRSPLDSAALSMASSKELVPSEIKRQERNAREQRRSLRTSQQFDRLRALLMENSIQPKANKSSVLAGVAKFMEHLEQRVEELEHNRERWIGDSADASEVERQDPHGGGIDCKQVFAHASVALAMANVEGRLIESNLQFEALSGCSREELKQLTVLSLTPPSNLQQTFDLLAAMLTDGTGKAPKHVSSKAMTKNDVSDSTLTLSLARDALGRPKFFLCHLLPNDENAPSMSGLSTSSSVTSTANTSGSTTSASDTSFISTKRENTSRPKDFRGGASRASAAAAAAGSQR